MQKWLEEYGIQKFYESCRKNMHVSSIEGMILQIVSLNPSMSDHFDKAMLKCGKHVGHYKETSMIKNYLVGRVSEYFCVYCKKIHVKECDDYQQHLKYRGYMPICLYSKRSGTGKTTLAQQVAKDLHYHCIKINASAGITSTMFSTSRPLFGEKTIILFDEAERWTKNNYSLIKLNLGRAAMIFTCNDITKFDLDDDQVVKIQINPLPVKQIKNLLKFNDPSKPDSLIEKIASECKGDVRQAVRSMETGDLIVDDDFSISEITKSIFRLNDEDSYQFLLKNDEDNEIPVDYLAKMVSENNTGPFTIRYITNELLVFIQKNKYIIDKELIFSLFSIIPKRKIQSLKYPVAQKKKNSEK